jgi:hypothetical protein
MKKRKSKKRELSNLRSAINDDLLKLNYELNNAVNKFFNNVLKNMSDYEGTTLSFNKLVVGITDFNELIDTVEGLFPIDAAFSKNIRYRGQRTVAIRQVTYTIGNQIGLSYSHMVRTLNNRHGAKVSHHATMIHSANVVASGIEIGDKVILSVWNKIMDALNSRHEKFINLTMQDSEYERFI